MITTLFALALEPSVLINEIAWMGDTNNWRNEWVELYNQGQQIINLDSWVLMIDENKTKLSGLIEPDSFFVISKGDLLKGGLKNTGNSLTLLDSSNNIVDEHDFSSGWPAGDNQTKRTMERIGSSWQTSFYPNGTPDSKNSLAKRSVQSSNIEIIKDKKNINNFLMIVIEGLAISSFISIISLYLNLRLKKYSIKD